MLEGAARGGIDAVVTHHTDGFRSGVARFNELLAERMAVPLLSLGDLADAGTRHPLLSFKVRELDAVSAVLLEQWLESAAEWSLFLHDFADLPLERRLVEPAAFVACGNLEIEAAVRALNDATETLWTPGLILDDRVFRPAEISVFSFGMAHKIRVDMFRRLRTLLDASGRSYAVFVSAANHETSSLRDSESVFDEMHEVFPESLYFLGNLSDVAVFNQLQSATFFAAFFERGVRGNNTSVRSAMERGAVVVTNLDEYSPPELVHLDNVIDIEQCSELPHDPLVLRRIAYRAIETTRARGWDELAARLAALQAAS
jgi:hypothetical protein